MIVLVLPDISIEDKLLAQARGGDQSALMQIYENYFDPIYQYLRLRVDDPMLAEDLTSDVFLRLMNSLKGSNAPQKSLRGWLFQVARNLLHDHYRTTRKFPTTTIDEWIRAPGSEEPEIQFIHRTDIERARQAVKMLSAEQQEVLILRFGQALSLQETADIMGKTTSAIKSLQFRATDTLRQILVNMRAGVDDGA